MANTVYNFFKASAMKGTYDLHTGGDTIKCMLLDNTHTIDQDNHDYVDDVNPDEISGTGYTAGGKALTNQAVTQDDSGDKGVWDADDVTWAASTITARYAVLYKDTGTPATSPLICIFDFTEDKSSSDGDFTIQWHVNGILNLT